MSLLAAQIQAYLVIYNFQRNIGVSEKMACLVQAFDACKPAPSLVKLLESGQVQVQGKRVFVPGCGYVLLAVDF